MTLINKAEALAAVDANTPAPAGGPFSHTNSMRVVAADIRRAIAALPARGVGVPESLRKFLRHDGLCGIVGGYGYCTCGLEDALAAPAPTDAAHVNETPKSEHDAGNVLTDAAQARECCDLCGSDVTDMDGHLVHDEGCNGETYNPAAQAREAALREAAEVAVQMKRFDIPTDHPHVRGFKTACELIADRILALIGEART